MRGTSLISAYTNVVMTRLSCVGSRGTLLAAFTLSFCAVQAAPVYEVVQIGNLPGFESGEPMAINNQNVVVGNSYAPGVAKGWMFTENGGMTSFGVFPNLDLIVRDVNNQGQAGGYYEGWNEAFRGQPGLLAGYNGPVGFPRTDAWGLNNLNQMVGWATDADNRERALRFNLDWTTTLLPSIAPGVDTRARRVNDAGVAVGYSGERAVLWTANNTLVDLHAMLPGAVVSRAGDINQAGWVTGYFQTAQNRLFGFTFNFEVGATVVHPAGQDELLVLRAINNQGQTVGISRSGFDSGKFEASASFNGVDTVLLNNLIDPNSGWDLTEAHDINDNGYIVGRGRFQGVEANYMLKPVPEPATMTALALGLAAVVKRRRRDRVTR